MVAFEKMYALQERTGLKEKKKFIYDNASDADFQKLLFYALNPMLTYKISEERLRKEIQKCTLENRPESTAGYPFSSIVECLDYLSGLRGMDDSTVRQVAAFLCFFFEEQARELYIHIISKTLRLGVTAKTVNDVIPNLLPEWEVQQSYPIEKYPVVDGTEFWLTQKLNGVRATFLDGQLIARSGSPYTGLEHITDVLIGIFGMDYVFDGELTLRDKGDLSDNEAFRTSTGILNSDDGDKTAVLYTIFDIINRNEFVNGRQNTTYSERRDILNSISEIINSNYVNVLPVLYHGNDTSVIPGFLDQMVREDKEGLILNTNVPYKRCRHKGILKIKRFYTMDLPIVRVEEGTGRLSGTLGALVLDFKGNEVGVGTGFTDVQRKEYWANRGSLIGTLCEVKYKEISQDKTTGAESLQFPVFVTLRVDKTERSYY